jgi:hypothetical protein
LRIVRGAVRLRLGKPLYGAEGLAAGALALGLRARVFVEQSKRAFAVEIEPARALPADAKRALAGEFLNAVLDHEYRQRVIAANAPLTRTVLSPLLARGFPAVPADPLEELEPQVKADRTQDVDELLAIARRMR